MSVVFVLVDALRSDYLACHRTAPFLSRCVAKGRYIEEVAPSLGFCERVEILTGVGFPENGYLSAIGRSVHGLNPYGFLRALPRRAGDVPLVRKVLARTTRKTGVALQPYEIPFSLLPEMVLTEDRRDHRGTNAFGVESLVDVCAEADKTISWHFAALGLENGTDEDRVRALKASFSERRADLYMLYLGSLDTVAHRYGPHSREVATALGEVDHRIQSLFEYISKLDSRSVLMVLGDHGMAEVKRVVDIEKLITSLSAELELVPWKDFKYFLDSTTCRLWETGARFREKEKMFVEMLARSLDGTGSWLSGEWDRDVYGKYVWVCSEGVLVFPDFFHRQGVPYAGMHGYSPETPAMKGLAMIYSEGTQIARKKTKAGRLGDTANTLCDLLGVRSPRDSQGTSWIESR